MKTANERIWDAADEADRLADLVQRRMSYVDDMEKCDELMARIRAALSAIKRLSNDRPGGA